jgi:hypothetical protein
MDGNLKTTYLGANATFLGTITTFLGTITTFLGKARGLKIKKRLI